MVLKTSRRIALQSSTFRINNTTTTTAPRSFASLSDVIQQEQRKVVDEPLQNVRKQLWEFYVSTGRGANALFEAIDVDENGSIEPEELQEVMLQVLRMKDGTPIDPKELMPYAWNRLEQRAAAGQSYNMKDFKKWLVAATKMSADMKNSRMVEYFNLHSQTGDQYVSDAEDEEAVYTWNEESMSQSLRRMQYAVRGEVVMKADQLASAGREILYTNIGTCMIIGEDVVLRMIIPEGLVSLCLPDVCSQRRLSHPPLFICLFLLVIFLL